MQDRQRARQVGTGWQLPQLREVVAEEAAQPGGVQRTVLEGEDGPQIERAAMGLGDVCLPWKRGGGAALRRVRSGPTRSALQGEACKTVREKRRQTWAQSRRGSHASYTYPRWNCPGSGCGPKCRGCAGCVGSWHHSFSFGEYHVNTESVAGAEIADGPKWRIARVSHQRVGRWVPSYTAKFCLLSS